MAEGLPMHLTPLTAGESAEGPENGLRAESVAASRGYTDTAIQGYPTTTQIHRYTDSPALHRYTDTPALEKQGAATLYTNTRNGVPE